MGPIDFSGEFRASNKRTMSAVDRRKRTRSVPGFPVSALYFQERVQGLHPTRPHPGAD
jgi:hypothetical protein